VKINSRIKNYKSQLQVESILKTKSIIFDSNQIRQNQFYTFKINFNRSRGRTKHTLNLMLNPVGINILFLGDFKNMFLKAGDNP